MFRRFVTIATSTVFFLFPFLTDAMQESVTPQEVVKKVRQKYDALDNLTAHFEQIFDWKLTGETQHLQGKLYLQKGERYRVETEDQIIVADGKNLWTYSKANQQVIIDRLGKAEETPLLQDLLLKYTEQYAPQLVGEENLQGHPCYILDLKPKDEDVFVKKVRAWVAKADWLLWKIQETDVNDNVNIYLINELEVNKPLPSALFRFQPPQSAEVIDLR